MIDWTSFILGACAGGCVVGVTILYFLVNALTHGSTSEVKA